MRIVFVIPYFYPAWEYGGQPRSAFELARGLVMRGHDVAVLTTDSGGPERLSNCNSADGCVQDVEGIRVFYYRNVSNRLAFRYRIFWPPDLFRNMKAQLTGADVVHVHELRSTLTVAAYYAAKKLSIPLVLSPHGGLPHLGRKAAKMVFDRLWGNRILRSVDTLIAVSLLEEQEARQRQLISGRIRQVPNAISASDYAVHSDEGRFRSRWNIGDCKLVLFLGRLHWIKGADVLIRAFHEICRDACMNAHLVIAGPDDGQEAELRRLVIELKLHERITFTGFLDRSEKLEAFASTDLVVIPSRSEVFAITALEALLCSRPVVVSSVCGLSPLPGSSEGLLTFAANDVQNLARQLTTALRDDSLRSAARKGRDFVLREFSLPIVAQKAEDVYREILDQEPIGHDDGYKG